MALIFGIIKWVVIVAVAFFILTFTVYFFNLDMKLTSSLQPLLTKIYDKRKRERKM